MSPEYSLTLASRSSFSERKESMNFFCSCSMNCVFDFVAVVHSLGIASAPGAFVAAFDVHVYRLAEMSDTHTTNVCFFASLPDTLKC